MVIVAEDCECLASNYTDCCISSAKRNKREVSHLSFGVVKIYELLKLCDKGWFLELYMDKDSTEYFAIEQSGSVPLVDQWKMKGMSLSIDVVFDWFDPVDKIIYAYFCD